MFIEDATSSSTRPHCSFQIDCHVPEGPVAGVGGLLILGERGHDGGQRSDGAGSQQARGGRGKGLDRVDNHDEGSVV
jgi:hypothetical protein